MFDRFNLMEQYAAASYCELNVNTTGSKVTCSAGNCPLVEAADTNTEVEFINVGATDVTGFVATDHTNRLVVISFRGSATLRNFITDVVFSKSESDICANCNVHDGFWISWAEARGRVLTALIDSAKKRTGYQMAIVGHSLGGAIATMCAAEMRKKGWSAELYTFGAPRVGDESFSQFVTGQGSNFRVTHYNDIVPRLPPLSFGNKARRESDSDVKHALGKRGQFDGFGFVHISPEYFIRSGNNVTVKWDDIDTYFGLVTFKGNTGQAVASIDAHRWYFNAISKCAS
ncbi:alpha/beta-hydrolase [Lindgomyces ingoldianus]|uniref:Alpha/beta-hydrolase n=1 Tax=Lindgomyces ingoldianus TaxID=673940 RepID=A0ACB6QNT8_9PLEO|nr:alpha/beta-hydrolase [Lindgomyces ingoldianus]KAF2468679.1 alpha/beta-hydrolase [Lindgomyces ingoldianus]